MSIQDAHQPKIDAIITALRDYAFGDIRKVLPGDNVLASFILCSCYIEQMATFRYGVEIGRKQFEDFVAEYLPDYDPAKLRADLRNRLVHNYSLGETYQLTQRFSQLHRHQNGPYILLNLENFVDDLGNALKKLINQFNEVHEIRANALQAFSTIKIIGGESMQIGID